jgi:predicted transcriptional regulator
MMLLEEAGAETIGTVVATLKITDQGDFSAQINSLITLGLVQREEPNLVLTERGKVALRT